MRFATIACLVAGLLYAAEAQAAKLYGRVYDTLRGEIYKKARIVLESVPPRETVTDNQGQYWFKEIAPGAYLIRIVRPGRGDVVGRVVVSSRTNTTIANLDLSRIEAPDPDDEY